MLATRISELGPTCIHVVHMCVGWKVPGKIPGNTPNTISFVTSLFIKSSSLHSLHPVTTLMPVLHTSGSQL